MKLTVIFINEFNIFSIYFFQRYVYAVTSHTGMMTLEMPTPQWPEPLFIRIKPASPQAGPQEFLISQKSWGKVDEECYIITMTLTCPFSLP